MTAPMHARDIKGKGRYYGRCSDDCPFGDDLFISVTNAQGVVNKPALVPSAVKITAEKAWGTLPRMVKLSRQTTETDCEKKRVAERCGNCRFCLISEIKAEHKNQWDYAKDSGTKVHRYAHALVLGEPMPYDEDFSPFAEEYLRFLTAWGVDLDRDVEAAETTVIDRKNKYAGTGDVWLWLPTGTHGKRQLWLIDLKSSMNLAKPVNVVYPDQELQLAGLRFAPRAILPGDVEVDVPKFDRAGILNLRSDRHALIEMNADRAAHKAFVHAVGLQSFFHTQNTKAWTPLVAPVVREPREVA